MQLLQSIEHRGTIEKCTAYLCSLAPHIHYTHAIANGFRIASGVVEGMCCYFVNDRMDKTGSRWSLQDTEAVLHLRVLRASDDFDYVLPARQHALGGAQDVEQLRRGLIGRIESAVKVEHPRVGRV